MGKNKLLWMSIQGMTLTISVALAVTIAGGESVSPGTAFLDAETILKGWESAYGDMKSMKVSYHEKLVEAHELPSRRPPGGLTRDSFVERIEQGIRYYIKITNSEKGFSDIRSLSEHAFDGVITREYWASENSGTVEKGLNGRGTETANVFKTYVLIGEPIDAQAGRQETMLHDVCKRHPHQTVRKNLEEVAGEPCHVIEYTSDYHGRDATTNYIWFAHDKGMLPMKYQEFIDGKLITEIVVEEVAKTDTEAGPVWYPAKARRLNDCPLGTFRYVFSASEFVPNVEVDKETFQVKFPVGTEIIDNVKGLIYRLGSESNSSMIAIGLPSEVDKLLPTTISSTALSKPPGSTLPTSSALASSDRSPKPVSTMPSSPASRSQYWWRIGLAAGVLLIVLGLALAIHGRRKKDIRG